MFGNMGHILSSLETSLLYAADILNACSTPVLLCVLFYAEALIGLRPPRRNPNPTEVHVLPFRNQMTDERSSQYVRSVNQSHNRDVFQSEPGDQRCRSVQISRCGVRLLRRVLIKDDVCNYINDYMDCNSRNLHQPYTFDIDSWFYNQSNMRGCVKKRTPVPLEQYRNRRSSVYGSSCCSDGINKCTMKSFQEFAENSRNCSKIETYESCMEQVAKQCFGDVLFELNLPFIISTLKNACRRVHRIR